MAAASACYSTAGAMARASRPMQAARHVGRFASTPPRRQRQPWAACSASSDRGPWYQAGPSSPDDLLQLLRQRHQAAAGSGSSSSRSSSQPQLGVVHLVGTGPGDPSLLTLKAAQLMQTADVVLYDRLVSEDILSMVHAGAVMVYVGKQKGLHTRTQEEIHDLLMLFAGQGATVLRLKGGDPYVFGRGGEEVQHLEARGVRVRVVPGITAASGISAELGIPLTHRGLATSVRFLTGHSREGGESELDETLAACADPHTTLVVYMGLGTLPALARQLAASGLAADTPAVAVERGTTPEQRAVYATLGELQEQVAAAALTSPTLIVIGQVVSLAPGWRRCWAAGVSLDDPTAAWAASAECSSSGGGISSSLSSSSAAAELAPQRR